MDTSLIMARGAWLGMVGASTLYLAGCGATLRAAPIAEVPSGAMVVSQRAADRCIHGTPGRDSPYRDELAGPVTDPELLPFVEQLDGRVRRTAVAAGIEPLLAQLLREEARVGEGEGSSEAVLAMRDDLSNRMLGLETQLLAMEFEVDCVRGLLGAISSDYQEAETDRQVALTIASLAVGAGTAIASAVWDLANGYTDTPVAPEGPLLTAIAGAVATTGIGIAVLVPPGGEVYYQHTHNVLRPLVRGTDDELVFPSFVFRLLTLPSFDESGASTPTPREELLAAFEEQLDDSVQPGERALVETLLFGEGGIHDIRLIALHESLLAELGASLDALARDIDELGAAVAFVLSHARMTVDGPAEPVVEGPAEPTAAE